MLLLNGDGVATFLGFEFVRLHAMFNDLPAALLIVAVVFEALYVLSKKDGFRHASFWTLIAGTIGAAAAVLSRRSRSLRSGCSPSWPDGASCANAR
jgi:hypothetical protein